LITHHIDRPGVVASITAILAKHAVNIAFMKLFRESKGDHAILILESDEDISKNAIEEILQNKNVLEMKKIDHIS
jgi:L-serine dehydratase